MHHQPLAARQVLVALALVGSLLGLPAVAQEALPTMTELKKMFDEGQHKPLLQKIARVSQLRGDAARPYDKVELETLRADTHIQLKNQPQAISAIADAVEAITPHTDPKIAAQARATQLLLKNATSLSYVPKARVAGRAVAPISLLDMKQRPAACAGLLADMQVGVQKSVKAARASRSLPPIINAVRHIGDMAAVELVATGADTASQQAADDLAAQAHQLMSDEVASLGKRARAIDQAANVLIEDIRTLRREDGGRPAPVEKIYRKTGLTSPVKNDLNDIIALADRIAAASLDFEGVSRANAANFKALSDAANKVAADARTTLTADYHSVQAAGNTPRPPRR